MFEIDKNVSQLVLKRTGKHDIMNTSIISRENRCQKTLHSQKNDILMLIPAILSPTVFKILLYSSYTFKNKQKRRYEIGSGKGGRRSMSGPKDQDRGGHS